MSFILRESSISWMIISSMCSDRNENRIKYCYKIKCKVINSNVLNCPGSNAIRFIGEAAYFFSCDGHHDSRHVLRSTEMLKIQHMPTLEVFLCLRLDEIVIAAVERISYHGLFNCRKDLYLFSQTALCRWNTRLVGYHNKAFFMARASIYGDYSWWRW